MKFKITNKIGKIIHYTAEADENLEIVKQPFGDYQVLYRQGLDKPKPIGWHTSLKGAKQVAQEWMER